MFFLIIMSRTIEFKAFDAATQELILMTTNTYDKPYFEVAEALETSRQVVKQIRDRVHAEANRRTYPLFKSSILNNHEVEDLSNWMFDSVDVSCVMLSKIERIVGNLERKLSKNARSKLRPRPFSMPSRFKIINVIQLATNSS